MNSEWVTFWSGEGRKLAETGFERAKRGESFAFEEYTPTAKGVQKWWHVAISPVRDVNGKVIQILAVSRDMTRQKELELELRRSNADLEQFAFAASHDLQEPLRKIHSYATLLAEKYKDSDDTAKKYSTILTTSALRMTELIRDLLDYSRVTVDARSMENVDMNQLLDATKDDLETSIRESQAAVSRDDLPPVRANPLQMRQLLQNLLGNALKYRGSDAPAIRMSCERQDTGWTFSLSDNGIGIDAVHHEAIFKIFRRLHTRTEYAGTGIGLALCQKIVEQHGGRIWVESIVGQGSIFKFSLPSLP